MLQCGILSKQQQSEILHEMPAGGGAADSEQAENAAEKGLGTAGDIDNGL